MTGQGIAQIVVYAVVLIALGYPLGIYMARVYTARQRSRSVALERGFLPRSCGDAATEQDWKSYAKTVLVFSVAFCVVLYAIQRAAGPPLPEPGPPAGRAVAHRAEHGRQLRHEHELAVLRRRVHDVVPHARWPGSRCRTSSRPASGWRCSPRSCAASRGARRRRSATSGVDLYRSLVYILLPLSIVLAVILISQGVPQTFHGHATATTLEGAHADDRARPGRVADRDQAARHERRRLLQLELGRAVREPDRLYELPRDARDPADPGGQVVHVREDGARATARLDGLRGDVRDLRDRRRASRSRRSSTARRCCAQLRREHHAGPRARAAAT